jgi:hypothetical protein
MHNCMGPSHRASKRVHALRAASVCTHGDRSGRNFFFSTIAGEYYTVSVKTVDVTPNNNTENCLLQFTVTSRSTCTESCDRVRDYVIQGPSYCFCSSQDFLFQLATKLAWGTGFGAIVKH